MNNSKNLGMLMIAVVAVGISGTFALADDSLDSLTITETVDQTSIYGHVVATVYDEFGSVKAYSQGDNIIVNGGLDMILNNLIGPVIANISNATMGDISHMKIGTGTSELGATATSITDITDCNADVITADSSAVGVVTLSATFTTAGDGSGCAAIIGEAGLFDGPTGGSSDTMFAQNSFSGTVTLTSNDSLDVDWTITFTDA